MFWEEKETICIRTASCIRTHMLIGRTGEMPEAPVHSVGSKLWSNLYTNYTEHDRFRQHTESRDIGTHEI
jgi:hypothetical protein